MKKEISFFFLFRTNQNDNDLRKESLEKQNNFKIDLEKKLNRQSIEYEVNVESASPRAILEMHIEHPDPPKLSPES